MHPSRRDFLLAAGSALASSTIAAAPKTQLAGRSLPQLRDAYHAELFDRLLPFWSKHGIDHKHGGFMCALDYDGTLKHTNKFHWYQGRGIWVYSYLFNYFGKNPQHLEIARKAKRFWLQHGRQADGWWAELLSRKGDVVRPFRGDVYSAFTTADGLQEYAWAAGDDAARELSLKLLKDTYAHVTRREYHDVYAAQPGWRVQGIWIYTLNCCTQMLRRWDDPQLGPIADACIEAIIDKHYNRDIGLNNEFLNHDFTRPKSEANKSLVGHCCQALWHVMDEAVRRGDDQLYRVCANRLRRHLDIGWDHVYGGLCEWVNVGQFDHVWGPQKLGDQEIDLEMKGEYNYVKSFWALNEVLVATLHAYDRLGAEWAARYFSLAQAVVDKKFSRHDLGQATYLLASDREMKFVPNSVRQDNFHPLRRLMRNLQILERLTTE
jgi:mannose/cellobiose epimerase-like protein (N-acyl-D-glucosamine 2-epimerase family)